jgi:DNA-binding XRE family transcriptional regulator
MITYRQKNKLNQKQFAQKLNIPVKTINDIESNRGIYNPNINNKIKRMIKM